MRRAMIAGVAFLALAGCMRNEKSTATTGWRAQVPILRVAAEGAVDDPDIARRWTSFEAYLEKAIGIDVEVIETSDYNGRVQALSSGQIDLAFLGGGSYANVDNQVGKLVAPIMVIRQAEGNTGYYSALLVRSESPYKTLQDLRGKALGYVDFNSTSGYLYPRFIMRKEGIDPETYFGKTFMAGGATQAVMSLANGQFDAAMINASGGTPETGFTTGSHFTMARRGLVDLEDFRVVWTAGPIPNSPFVVRTDRPQELIDVLRGALMVLPYDDPETWSDIGQAEGGNFAAVDRKFYEDVIAIRNQDIAERRGLSK